MRNRIKIAGFLSLLILCFQNCSGGFNVANLVPTNSSFSSSLGTPDANPPPNLNNATCDEGYTGGAYTPQSGPADLITVDATKVVRNLCPEFWGVNDSPAWDSLWNSPASYAAVSPLGFAVGRYWGGSGADWINWSNFPNNFTNSFPDPLTAWNTISQSGIQKLLIQSNPTTIGGNDPSGAPITQAVNYFKSNNIPIFALEIGNEQDNNQAQDALSVAQYSQAFTAQCSAAKAVDASYMCMGPVSTNDWYWWPTNGGTNSPDTLEKFLALQGNKSGTGLVDKISLHWYPGYDMNKIESEFLGVWPLIQTAIQKYDSRSLPVYFTEFSVSDAGAHTTWMGSAIEAADMMQTFKLYGVGGVDYFTIHQVANNWGVLRGSGEANPNSPTATYYSLYLLHKMGSMILNLTQGADRTAVSAHATMKPDGSMQVMLINKTAQAQNLRVAFNGFDPTGYTVSQNSLIGQTEAQTNVQFNGVTMPAPTALPAPSNSVAAGAIINVSVEAFTIRVLDIHR